MSVFDRIDLLFTSPFTLSSFIDLLTIFLIFGTLVWFCVVLFMFLVCVIRSESQ